MNPTLEPDVNPTKEPDLNPTKEPDVNPTKEPHSESIVPFTIPPGPTSDLMIGAPPNSSKA